MKAIDLVFKQLEKQKEKGYDLAYDEEHHPNGELLRFANYLISADSDYFPKTFNDDNIRQFFMKPRLEQLAVSCGLVIAEMDRLIAKK